MIRKPQPKTARGARELKKREPTAEESAKICVFLKGSSSSSIVNDALKDLFALKKPDATLFTKKNSIHPFEDFKQFEFLSLKNGTLSFSMFIFRRIILCIRKPLEKEASQFGFRSNV